MGEKLQVVRVADVFVTANPEYTYWSRDSAKLEEAVADHLDEKDKLLLLTGPTKTGKTVLIDHVVPQIMDDRVVAVEGPMVSTAAEVWSQIVDDLGWYTDVGNQSSDTTTKTKAGDVHVDGSLGVVKGGGKGSYSKADAVGDVSSQGATRSPVVIGRRALLETGAALIIDDFHHIAPRLQETLVKQLKSIVKKRKAPIVLIAVPHHAADVIRAEREMEGRLKHVKIPDWSDEELQKIAGLGFPVLNVKCPEDVSTYLASVSWGSPHLMQVLCRELAKHNGIRKTQEEETTLQPPESWDDFLRDVAIENTSGKTLERLATGAQSRSKRVPRDLADSGGTTDLYRALLVAIGRTGPKRALTYDDLREGLEEVLVKLPQSNEVTDHLKRLHKIAAAEASQGGGTPGEAVLEYAENDRILHVVDPFFAFRLRWAPSAVTLD